MMKLVAGILFLALSSVVTAQNFDSANPAFPESLKTIHHIPVKMRDGVERATDVYLPNGVAFKLVDGVIRARYREGFEEPKLIQPGKVYKYDIDLSATSYVLSPGDRLRVDITSSNFPRLARNLNTGAPFAQTTEMKVTRQTIHMNSEHASRVVLPVIP